MSRAAKSPPARTHSTRVESTLIALADPHRKAVIDLLATEPKRAGDIAGALSLTPQALARHLRVLRRNGLIEHQSAAGTDDARIRVYQLRQEPFTQLRTWLDEVESFWIGQLSSFREHVEKRRSPATRSGK